MFPLKEDAKLEREGRREALYIDERNVAQGPVILLNVLKCAAMPVEGVNKNTNSIVKLEPFLVVQADSSEYKIPVVANEGGLVVEF